VRRQQRLKLKNNQTTKIATGMDTIIAQIDIGLRTLFNVGKALRAYPAQDVLHSNLSKIQRKHAAGLMRVNHVGEVCAQALYAGQALVAKTPAVRLFNEHAAIEERDHLQWTAQRLRELNAKPSVFNLLWYGGAWALGVAAGLLGDKISLAFVQETEKQVETHLHSHESMLPEEDLPSRAIVAQMKADEAAHGQQALDLGAVQLPKFAQLAMKVSAQVMTKTAYYV
jgi:3-demethoxyubiquinol 3-hydroxylase